MSVKNAPLSLKITPELKEKLQKIAKEKDTSLNDMSSQVFTEFVESYEIEQVKDNEIPTVEEARKIRAEKQKKLFNDGMILVKRNIKEMLENGFIRTRVSGVDIPSYSVRSDIVLELRSLGYAVHEMDFGFSAPDSDIKYLADDIIIGLTDEDIEDAVINDKPNNFG